MFVIRRHPENPILSPRREYPWEALAAFNPSVLKHGDETLMYYRAIGNPDALVSPHAGQSSIGLARSEDGVHFHSRTQVVMPTEHWDAFGCEDPRATFFEGRWYVFYTALGGFPYGPENIKVAVAVGDAPDKLYEKHLVTPFNAKAATLFPERINGKVVLLLTAHTDWTAQHPRPTIAFAYADQVSDFYEEAYWEKWLTELPSHALPDIRRTDEEHVEVGATPLKTEKGWLFIYSYIQHYYEERRRTFCIEASLLDLNNPQVVLARTYPFMVPEEIYELYGLIPNIVFPSGALIEGDRLDIYYGAADTSSAKASVRLSDLLRDLDTTLPARTFVRAPENPILVPVPQNSFEDLAVLNAATIDLDGSVHILYRAMGTNHTSTVGYARSKDGVHIDYRSNTPIYVPRADFEQKHTSPNGNSGCEDPRAVVIDGRVYITYTAYDGVRPPRGALSSISVEDFLAERFDAWTPPVLVTPDEVDDKDVSLLPEAVNGQYVLYHRINGRVCADILPDLSFTKRVSRCIEILAPREGMWDAAKVGIGGAPIKVPEGWLFIYHGVSHRSRYRLGAVLLDPTGLTVLARTADPIFEPVEPYEMAGEVNQVVFTCGAVVRGDQVFMYYGGGDKVLGVAVGSLARIMAALT